VTRDRVLLRCHVCDCHIQDGEPYEVDGWGYAHAICSLQVEL
jgi:hypothetical protein